MKRSSSDNPPRICEHDGCHLEGAIPCDKFIRAQRARRATRISEPAKCGHASDDMTAERGCGDCRADQFDAILAKRPSEALCNCSQSLGLTDALRRIVAACGDVPKRDPFDVLTEINLIAKEGLPK